jgi:hypothetical protein
LLPFWNEYTQEESKKWWLPERFEFNYLFALIYWFFILLTFLLGPIVPFRIWACGMNLWEEWDSAHGTRYRYQCRK